jgi:hypothetical protein
MQIKTICIYSHRGDRRDLQFVPGRLNVITGASKTGKSALIDIIDYCTGREVCNIAEGVIRKNVSWYAVLFQIADQQLFVARRNPEPGKDRSPEIYFEEGSGISIPAVASSLFKNTTVETLQQMLGGFLGINENVFRPPAPTRPSLEANFRHAVLFSFQNQDEIDGRSTLFHRQGEPFLAQAIKDTFPYFLGAMDEDRLAKQGHLDLARKELRQLERQLREAQDLDTADFPRARILFEEAKTAGLISERAVASTYEATIAALRTASADEQLSDRPLVGDPEEALARLRVDRRGLREELTEVKQQIHEIRLLQSDSTGYEREAREQRARLSAIGLYNRHESGEHCPLCQSALQTPIPTVTQIRRTLEEVSSQLEAVEQENPRLQERLIRLRSDESAIEGRLQQNQRQINDQTHSSEILRIQQDDAVLKARVIGRIALYLETASDTRSDSALDNAVRQARARVEALESDLDPSTVQERMDTYLNLVSRYLTEYSSHLDLEYSGSQLRLDVRNLTVVADSLDGPVPLLRMGSGENWVGYHVLIHLALHKWFRQKSRPVPAFLVFDQPSQAYYPPDQDVDGKLDVLGDEDRRAVNLLYTLIHDVVTELAPGLQIIVLDHADLQQAWFQSAVVERWRGGKKLVPQSWLPEIQSE